MCLSRRRAFTGYTRWIPCIKDRPTDYAKIGGIETRRTFAPQFARARALRGKCLVSIFSPRFANYQTQKSRAACCTRPVPPRARARPTNFDRSTISPRDEPLGSSGLSRLGVTSLKRQAPITRAFEGEKCGWRHAVRVVFTFLRDRVSYFRRNVRITGVGLPNARVSRDQRRRLGGRRGRYARGAFCRASAYVRSGERKRGSDVREENR